ncbi:MAG TPA: hypothetical protein VHW25_11170 [Steroidobacteraceae bacterium]|jgi:hypothetical protein|nr:hypothetical protein [Steroidobacteraceae bacterium]
MIEPARQSRSTVIARRMQILEMEAAVQRATLAATFAKWEQRRTLSWIFGAAKLAGGVLATPTIKWVATALLMRLIRSRFG